MTFEELVRIIAKRAPSFLAAAIFIAPIVWVLASAHFQERIHTLEARVELLRDQLRIVEDKLRQPPPSIQTPGTPPQPDTAPRSEPALSDRTEETSRLPYLVNPSQPTKADVRALARFYGLFNRWQTNPHLQFEEGDISYWYEQKRAAKDLKREFESRRIVLERAEQSGEQIPSPGDLSHKADQVQAMMLRP